MDFEKLSNQWKNIKVKAPAGGQRRRLTSPALVRLHSRLYRRMLIMVAVCLASPVLYYMLCDLLPMSVLTTYSYMIFFGTALCIYIYLARLFRDRSYVYRPMADAMRELSRREILLVRFKIVLNLLALPVVALMFVDVYHDSGASLPIAGGVVGGLLGGIIGFRWYRTNRRLLREIRQFVAEAEAED